MTLKVENYFVLFGLPQTFYQDNAKIKTSYLQLQKKIHPDNFIDAAPQEKMLAMQYAATVNHAYQTLCDPLKRGIYLLKLEGIHAQSETDNTMPMEFLVEQMQLRDDLSSALENDHTEEIAKITKQIDNAFAACQEEFTKAMNSIPKELIIAIMCIKKMQFYRRIHEEIQAFA